MLSPAAVLVSNGAISPHAPPSAAAFLDSTPGAYTTARGTLLWWPRHLRRLVESATLLARSHPHLLGLPLPLPRSRALDVDFLSIQSLVNPSVRVAIHEMRTRSPMTEDEHLALTVLVRGAGADSISGSGDGLDVFVHVGTYAPPVFGESGARLAVAGRGRDAAAAKYAPWARIRKSMEKMRPPGVTELLLTNDGDHILEGAVTNFFVVCQQAMQTAPLSDGVLPGIIRQIVIEVCHDIGIPVREMSPSWSNNEIWKEAFVTSSLRLIQHVESIQVPLFWEDIQSKTWSDVPWAVKKFQGAGCITTQIQREILKRARREEYGINSLL
uniref:Protein tyrosine kinase n=1 Tax=Saccharum hybrid cultivar SP80-3280 TaxID=193079 RepID=A0A2R4QNI6_9POAL|nr:protein tyrosine kinase [Saccharum hybrid cultivar SP80-3280]